MFTEIISVSTRIIELCDEKALVFDFEGNSVETDNHMINMIRVCQMRESHCRANTRIRRKRSTQKSRTMRNTVRNTSGKVNHSSKVVLDRNITTEFTRSIYSTRIV